MVKKQQKPNLAVKRTKGRDGITRVNYYYRLKIDGNEKYIPIKEVPDTPEFDRAYWAIRSGNGMNTTPRTNYKMLVESYLKSSSFRSKADGTKRKYRVTLDQIKMANGVQDFTKTRRRDIVATQEHFSATPRKADHFVQMFSILFNYAIELEYVTTNPAKGIKLFGAQKQILPWPKGKQEAYERYCIKHDLQLELTAFYLGTGTGQRPGDLVKMKWEHFDGEYMSVLQEKTDSRISVFCPARLRNALDLCEKAGVYILAKDLRNHITYNALEKRVLKVRTVIEAKDFVMHGWRFTAAVEMAEAGCSDSEIQAVTGHKTLEMVQKYRAQANQRKLSKRGQMRRDKERNEAKT